MATGLHESTRFLLDLNVFIDASKRGWTRTTHQISVFKEEAALKQLLETLAWIVQEIKTT